MTLHAIAVSAGYLGAALGVAMVVPQIVRTLRDRTTPGVSALSWGLTALACTTWLLYGIRAAELPQIPGNVLLASGSALIVLLVPSAAGLSARVVGLLVPALVLSAFAALAPTVAIGVAAFGMAVVSGVPQTVRSLNRRGDKISAVSLPSWLLRVASQASWLFFGIVIHDFTVVMSATFILSNALIVVASEVARRPAPAPAVAVA
jgi:uncharacterized protein with PQ loop repeat